MTDNITKDSNNDHLLHLIKFADVLDRPHDTINQLTETLGYRQTSLTARLISKVNRRKEVQVSNKVWTDVDERELIAARNMCCKFNLDTHFNLQPSKIPVYQTEISIYNQNQ